MATSAAASALMRLSGAGGRDSRSGGSSWRCQLTYTNEALSHLEPAAAGWQSGSPICQQSLLRPARCWAQSEVTCVFLQHGLLLEAGGRLPCAPCCHGGPPVQEVVSTDPAAGTVRARCMNSAMLG